jgi:hypothetical protein
MNIKEVQYQNADNWGFFVDIEKEKIQPFNTDNTNNNNNKIKNNVIVNVNVIDNNANVIDNNANVIDNNANVIDNDDNEDDNIIPKLCVFAQIISIVFVVAIVSYIILIVV